MFRENVLIALTILITILALSFVILLTVYLQIHQSDERQKRQQKFIDEQEMDLDRIPTNSSLLKDAEDTLALITDMAKKEMVFEKDLNANGVSKTRQYQPMPRPPTKATKATTTTTSTTTENPDDEGFYTDDDFFLQFPPPPSDTRSIPYNLYTRNGHVILRVPQSINLSDDMEHVKKVMEQLNELYHFQKKKDDERKQYTLNGYKPWYPQTKDKQEGRIWIRNPYTTTTTTPKSIRKNEPFDDSALFDMVSSNRMRRLGMDPFGYYGKRRKRSVDENWRKVKSRKRYHRYRHASRA